MKSRVMEMFRVLLNIAVILSASGAAIVPENVRINQILDLKLPEESYKEPFFGLQDKHDSENKIDEPIGMPLSPDDFTAGQKIKVKEFAPAAGKDPISMSGYFEGDIKNPKLIQGRNAIQNNQMKWPGGEVPYVIAKTFNNEERSIIARGMDEFHKRTCIRFRPRNNEMDFVFVTRKDGCFSMIGRDGGLQLLSLGDGCMYVGIVIHEFMHAVGFWHEQSRADRDDFVTIFWDNIQEGQTHNFAKYTDGRMHHLGENYDYGSIMHYGIYEFSRFHDRPTILPNLRNVNIGQRTGFSQTDVRKINKLYQCDSNLRESCVDVDSQCRGWAEKGECQKNPKWMLANCRRSCNQCRKRSFPGNELRPLNRTESIL